jgi:hypothetical protein
MTGHVPPETLLDLSISPSGNDECCVVRPDSYSAAYGLRNWLRRGVAIDQEWDKEKFHFLIIAIRISYE